MSTLSDRRFRASLGRKGGYEASWVFESEIDGDAIFREKMPVAPAPESAFASLERADSHLMRLNPVSFCSDLESIDEWFPQVP